MVQVAGQDIYLRLAADEHQNPSGRMNKVISIVSLFLSG